MFIKCPMNINDEFEVKLFHTKYTKQFKYSNKWIEEYIKYKQQALCTIHCTWEREIFFFFSDS